MSTNYELELALQFIEKTDRNLFITGKAGTGKTTFLHKIKSESLKRMVVVAPTGVAAINAKGVTIHSFFQMPFGPILPNQISNSSRQQRKFSKTKIDIIKSLDLIVIDEISMVRADLLDGIDQVMRRYKNRNKVFGGAQILMIGDLQQLAPVVKPNEWSSLQQHYDNVYFFSSSAYQEANVVSIELQHIYRQKNQSFIHILNEIRNNNLSKESATILNNQYDPKFSPTEEEGYITLTTHNDRAIALNQAELEKLPYQTYFFKADVSGKFNENAFPNDHRLALKVGAQVMFIKNDTTPEKRYFNGKIGIITAISKKSVTVQCPNETDVIVAERDTWEHITYSINEDTKEIKEDITGSFSQIPLRLAWAITIHKSQGLTFDKAIIDAAASFAHGQTYVALSRCTSLEGIVLKTKIHANTIVNDTKVSTFTNRIQENHPDEKELNASEKQFQLNLIAELFDYQPFLYPTTRLIDIFYKNRTSIQGEVINHLEAIKDLGIVPFLKIVARFMEQLNGPAESIVLPENDEAIQTRFKKAIVYFVNQTKLHIEKPLKSISFSTDNKAVKKDFNKQFEALQERLEEKLFSLQKMSDSFNTNTYLQVRANAVLQDTERSKKEKTTTKRDPIIVLRLRALRDDIAKSSNIPHFQIFTQKTLYLLSELLPRNEAELLKIKGMGKIRVQKYGTEILEVVEEYCEEHGIDHLKTGQKEAKKSTKQISFELFKNGFSVKEIANERNLTQGTIEGHLASFIPSGDIDVLELIELKRYNEIVDSIEKITYTTLKELKEQVDAKFSFSELKMVLMSQET